MGRLLPLLLPVLAAACQSGEDPVAVDGPYNVRLLIDPQSASTRADGDVSAIHQLRVYVFNTTGKRVGYYENMALSATGQAYYVPFRLTEGGLLTFYVVANEGGAGLTLTEETVQSALEEMSFTTSDITYNDRTEYGDLLTGKTDPIDITAKPEGSSPTVVTCALSRPFSLLNVFFAKTDASLNATVTGIELHDYTTSGYIYEVCEVGRDYEEGPLTLLGSSEKPFEVEAIVPENQQMAATANYGNYVVSHPVSLAGQGTATDKWDTDWKNEQNTASGQTHHPRLRITYTVNSAEKEAIVYLPPMRDPNARYNVKCLIKDQGGFGVRCTVADWIDAPENNYELSNIGHFTITETNMKLFNTETGEDNKEIKNYATQYVEGADAQSRQLVFTLQMTSPEGVRWQAHLTNAQDFEFVGSAEGVGGEEAKAVTLQVRPTKRFDTTGERPRTELYVTIGTTDRMQIFDHKREYTADGQTLHIVQVTASEWDNIE